MQFFTRLSLYIMNINKIFGQTKYDESEWNSEFVFHSTRRHFANRTKSSTKKKRRRWKNMELDDCEDSIGRILNSTHCADVEQQRIRIVRSRQHHILDLRMNKPFEFILMVFISEIYCLWYIFSSTFFCLFASFYSSLRCFQHSLFLLRKKKAPRSHLWAQKFI